MDNLLKNIPQKGGVYKFLDDKKEILYIGKALNLKTRVSSYFTSTHSDRPHIIKMLQYIKDVETITTENEIESLILESALIKKYRPKFNVLAKDDKSFSWIYISTQDEFPRVKIVRSIKKDEIKKGKLFGPYPKGNATKRLFNYIRKIYPFCTCTNPKEPCLYYHLNLCPAPFQGKISKEDYRKNINGIINFLSGRKKNIVSSLKKEMEVYAKTKDFEKAAILRDKINDLEYISQKISVSPFEAEDEYFASKLTSLKEELFLKKLSRIECFDISNIQGQFAFGAMSVAIDGRLDNSEYRIFKIRETNKPDDPKMLFEVLYRRIKKYTDLDKPDLILIDGGISQLSVLKNIIPKDIKVIAISKGKRMKRKNVKQVDEFWTYDSDEYKNIKIKSIKLLVELRDEAHRFGIKYHRKSRAKYAKASVLDKIEGIGEKRKKALIKKFGSIENIKKASVSELNEVVKNKNLSGRILNSLTVHGSR